MEIYRRLAAALRKLDIDGSRPAIVHTALSSFGRVKGGAQAVLGALFEHFDSLIVPAFTYKTMLVPGIGPPNNAIDYDKRRDADLMAEMYHPNLPADRLMGILPETLRQHPTSQRSGHPILSFAGVNAAEILRAQTMQQPFAPIAELAERDGWVLLLGVNQTSNTSIHWAERLAGRKTFLRWALTKKAVRACPSFPPCSDGFNALHADLAPIARTTRVAKATVNVYPLKALIEITRAQIEADPIALLCPRAACPRCEAIRWETIQKKKIHQLL